MVLKDLEAKLLVGVQEAELPESPMFKRYLTIISPPPFPQNCDIINIHEHNLHMIIIFVFLFVSK